MELIDTHCHLFMEPLSADPDAVLRRAAEAGIGQVIVPAYDPASWNAVEDLSRLAGVRVAVGLHPWAAGEPLDLDDLAASLDRCNAAAVGEIGLDTLMEEPGLDVQLRVLEQQLDLALDLDLPVILHCRGAFAELRDALVRRGGRIRGVLHAWSRGPELAREFLDLGLYLGLGGAVTRDRAKRVRRAAVRVPLGRIVLETDAPSIGLDGVEPAETEPRHVLEVVRALAGLRDETLETLAEETTRNARRLFRL